MSQLTVTELARAGPNERPLATMDSIMAGTFSSDDSETARLRGAQLEGQVRGVPGALLGPLAEPWGQVMLTGNPCGTSIVPFQGELTPMQLQQSMSMGYPLQAPPLQSMSQTSAPPTMQSSGMPLGSAPPTMQSSGMPLGSALPITQSSGMPLGSAPSTMQSWCL